MPEAEYRVSGCPFEIVVTTLCALSSPRGVAAEPAPMVARRVVSLQNRRGAADAGFAGAASHPQNWPHLITCMPAVRAFCRSCASSAFDAEADGIASVPLWRLHAAAAPPGRRGALRRGPRARGRPPRARGVVGVRSSHHRCSSAALNQSFFIRLAMTLDSVLVQLSGIRSPPVTLDGRGGYLEPSPARGRRSSHRYPLESGTRRSPAFIASANEPPDDAPAALAPVHCREDHG